MVPEMEVVLVQVLAKRTALKNQIILNDPIEHNLLMFLDDSVFLQFWQLCFMQNYPFVGHA